MHLQLFIHMNLTFYIHQTIQTESGSGFSRKLKSGSEKCSRLRIRAHLHEIALRKHSWCNCINVEAVASFFYRCLSNLVSLGMNSKHLA